MTDPNTKLSAKLCTSMSDVRYEIDRLDRCLVHLMAERQTYIEAAGRIKPAKIEVRLNWRIEEVVAKVLAEAQLAGLSSAIAEPVWRELIERSIQHEHQKWDENHSDDLDKR